MATICVDCKGEKIHSFQVRSDYGNFYAVNNNEKLENRPYYVEGYYCEDCDEAVSVEETD